jgi:hypothetical protein
MDPSPHNGIYELQCLTIEPQLIQNQCLQTEVGISHPWECPIE